MLLLVILTFITVVLIMTGALVPVLMYCAAIAAVLYVLLLIKRLFVDLIWPGQNEPIQSEPDHDDTSPEYADDREARELPGNDKEPDEGGQETPGE